MVRRRRRPEVRHLDVAHVIQKVIPTGDASRQRLHDEVMLVANIFPTRAEVDATCFPDSTDAFVPVDQAVARYHGRLNQWQHVTSDEARPPARMVIDG